VAPVPGHLEHGHQLIRQKHLASPKRSNNHWDAGKEKLYYVAPLFWAVALLVLATISNPVWGVVYLAVFGIGTVAGMMLITVAISIPFAYTSRRLAGFNRSLGFASSLSSLVFGMFLIYQIAFVDGLFTGYAHWTPR
jgi:hypothetical protein